MVQLSVVEGLVSFDVLGFFIIQKFCIVVAIRFGESGRVPR
jgi:hypothetical protein